MIRTLRQQLVLFTWLVTFLAGLGCSTSSQSGDTLAGGTADGRTLTATDAKRGIRAYTELVAPGKLRLTFENAPAYVQPLEMAPKAREPELGRGKWLVVASAAVSIPDWHCILDAIEAFEGGPPGVKLGVRLFGDYSEIKTWYPEYNGETSSPLWLVYSEGRVVRAEAGVLSTEQIAALVKSGFTKQ